MGGRRKLPIYDLSWVGSPPVLERKEPWVTLFSPSKIKLSNTLRFSTGNGSPKKPWRCPVVVEPFIGASIFVIEDISELQRKNGRDRDSVFIGDANLQGFAQIANQTVKPFVWCWRNPLATPGNQEETVEVLEENLGSAAFLDEAAAFRPLNPALNGIFIESVKYAIQIWPQIK